MDQPVLGVRPRTPSDAIETLLGDPSLGPIIAAHRVIEPRAPRYGPWPTGLDGRIVVALKARGVEGLYTHQAKALETIRARRNARRRHAHRLGQDALLQPARARRGPRRRRPRARSTSSRPRRSPQDQLAELHGAGRTTAEIDMKTFTYDGDTPATRGASVRAAGHIVITNPDMLHTGILPHHTKWVQALREPAVRRDRRAAHLPRRVRQPRRQRHPPPAPHLPLLRLRPASSSAARRRSPTRASWRSGSSTAPVDLVDDNGAPRGRRRIARLQPAGRQPRARHPPGSSLLTGQRLAERLHRHGVQTIVFAPSRTRVEVLLTLPARDARSRRRAQPDTIARLPRRLPAERAARDRARAARRADPRRRRHERARAGHRHRRPRCGGAASATRARIASRPGSRWAAPGRRAGTACRRPRRLVVAARPVRRHAPRVPVRQLAGAQQYVVYEVREQEPAQRIAVHYGFQFSTADSPTSRCSLDGV